MDSKCSYNGVEQVYCTWAEKDLTANDLFFNLGDVKPGDDGEVTLSLHSKDNDACGFVKITRTSDADNNCTEPEQGSAGELCTVGAPEGAINGELAENVIFTIWADDGDNVQEDGEPILTTGTLDEVENWGIGLLAGDITQYYGIKWELPTTIGNEVQSDSFTADVEFRAEQKRNQYPNGCPTGEIIEEPEWIDAVGAINDTDAPSGAWYMRHVGNPAVPPYTHAYQWGPLMTCDPNNTAVTFTGTIDVNPMPVGGVSLIGLLDKGFLETGTGGYQSGAYLYVFKKDASTIIIGPSDGAYPIGELVQTARSYAIGDGVFDIVMTIYGQPTPKITVTVDGDSPNVDDYGLVEKQGVQDAYAGAEFANGAYPGWDNFPTNNYMPYNLTITGCTP